MRLLGWCTQCRKVKWVTVGSAGMVAVARGELVVGVCADCEETTA